MVHSAPDAVSKMMNRGEDHIPGPANYANAAQDVTGHLCCRDSVLTHVQHGVHQDPYIFLCFPTKPILVHGVIFPWGQDLAFTLVEIHVDSR